MKVIQLWCRKTGPPLSWLPTFQFYLVRSFHFSLLKKREKHISRRRQSPQRGSSAQPCPYMECNSARQPLRSVASGQGAGHGCVSAHQHFSLPIHAVPKLIYQTWPIVPGSLFLYSLSEASSRYMGYLSCLAILSQPRLKWMDGNVAGGRWGIIS